MCVRKAFALSVVAVLSLAGVLPAVAGAKPRTASAIGVSEVQGKNVRVEVFVEVRPGQTAREATGRALAAQDARRLSAAAAADPGGPGFTGLVWDVLPVSQSYNPTGQPLSAQGDLVATHSAWSSVPGSAFEMSFGETTTRCPSLVAECPGAQRLDARSDVGWRRLARGTLGVTWSALSIDEADMALSTRVAWSAGCTPVSGRYDVQTVLLHENGHVAGLDHATSPGSIMYPSYRSASCTLGGLDQDAIRALYPGA
jgi:hypothetical protein